MILIEEYKVRRPATDINTKQRKILDFIIENIMENHMPPTVREICEYIGLNSTSSVASHLAASIVLPIRIGPLN